MERELILVVKMLAAGATKNSKELENALKQLEKKVSDVDKKKKSLGKTLVSLGRGLARVATSFKALVAAMAAFLAVRQVVGMLTSVADQIDRMGELASEIGITTEALSGLAVAAQFGGSSMEELTIALRQLQKRSAASGDFRALDVILGEVSDKLAATKNETERAALAAKYFGEEAGAKLINTLSGGSAALAEFNSQARGLGVIFSERTVAIAGALNDSIDRFRLAVTGVFAGVIAKVGPTFIAIFETLAKFIAENRESVVSFFSAIALKIAEIVIILADAIVFAIRDFDSFLGYIEARIKRVILEVKQAVLETAMEIALAFANNPFVSMVPAVRSLSAALEENDVALVGVLETQLELTRLYNENSIFRNAVVDIESLIAAQKKSNNTFRETRGILENLRKIFNDFRQGVSDGLKSIKQEINDVAGNVSSAMTGAFGGMKGAAVEFFEAIYSGSMTAKEAFKQLVKNIVSQLINLAAQLTVIVGLALLLNVLLPGFGAALSGAGGVIGGAGGLAASMGSAGSSAGPSSGSGTAGEGVLVRQPGTNIFSPPSGSSGPVNGAIIDANPPTSKAMVGRNSAGSGNIYIGQVQAMDAASFSAFVAKPENAKALRDQQNANLVKRDSTKRALP